MKEFKNTNLPNFFQGQHTVSDASLSSTKSSSNESISELPENGISPKTPTSTPINESLIEQVAVNGTEAIPFNKEQSPTKFAQQVAEFVTQAQHVIVSQVSLNTGIFE